MTNPSHLYITTRLCAVRDALVYELVMSRDRSSETIAQELMVIIPRLLDSTAIDNAELNSLIGEGEEEADRYDRRNLMMAHGTARTRLYGLLNRASQAWDDKLERRDRLSMPYADNLFLGYIHASRMVAEMCDIIEGVNSAT